VTSESGILVGIPAYNEERTIGSIVAKATEHADEVYVYDDGSRDDTARVAQTVGAVVESANQNHGKGAAIQRIFEYAHQNQFETVVLLDGDGQHDPDEIPKLLKTLSQKEVNIVLGSRYLKKDDQTPKYRRIGQRTYDFAAFLVTGRWFSDAASGFRALDRKAIEQLEIDATGVGVEMEMLDTEQFQIEEVPVSAIYDVPHPHTEVSVSNWLRAVRTTLRLTSSKYIILTCLLVVVAVCVVRELFRNE
jgi:glycosyltransferase involved in cell wall biosynthesis